MAQKKQTRANLARTERRRALAQSRKRKNLDELRAQKYAELRRARNRRLALWLASTLAVLLIGTGVLYWATRPDPPPNFTLNSLQVSKSAGDRTINETADAYQITYMLESFGTSEPKVFEYRLTVRRPFDLDQDYKEDGALVVRRTQNFAVGAQYIPSEPQPEVVKGPPAISETDTRFSVIIDDLVADGIYVPKERRRVLDKDCVVYRTGSSLGARTFVKPTATDYADICIDDRGFVLEELSVVESKVFARRTAVAVEVAPTDLSVLSIPPDAPVSPTTEFTELPTDGKPNANYHVIARPEGYTLKGRYKVVAGTDQPTPVESYTDVYVNGINTIIVRQGPTSEDSEIEFDTAETRPVPAMTDARFFRLATGTALIGHPSDGWYVRVFATAPWATLAQIASTLAPS